MIEKSTLEKVEYSRSLATVLGLATTLDFEHDGKELVKLDFPRTIQVNGLISRNLQSMSCCTSSLVYESPKAMKGSSSS